MLHVQDYSSGSGPGASGTGASGVVRMYVELTAKLVGTDVPDDWGPADTPPAATLVLDAIPTFYINRECDEARLAAVRQMLRAADIKAERIVAVEGLNVPAAYKDYF